MTSTSNSLSDVADEILTTLASYAEPDARESVERQRAVLRNLNLSSSEFRFEDFLSAEVVHALGN